MRVKDVTVAGTKFKISSLSVDQVTELVFPPEETQVEGAKITASVKGNKHFIKERTCPIVAASLNNATVGDAEWFSKNKWQNALSSQDGAKIDSRIWWTGDLVAAKMDWAEVIGLHSEIVAFTGLKTEVAKESGGSDGAGEAPAATAIH